ncbi:MAG: glycosyltransferase [Verrucomicrobiota bacterium]
MRISVVVPAFNEERLIAGTLAAIEPGLDAFRRRCWEVERIVCDNNSTDATAAIARAAGATVVFEPVNQIARARNRGAEAATGDWIVFIDADTHPPAALFEDVAAAIESGRCIAGGATIRLDGHYPRAAAITAGWNWVSRTARWFAGSFVFCDAKAFREAGGFSARLFAGEEIDLSRRLKPIARRAGREILILHRHPVVTSARKIHLYSTREHLTFLARTVLGGGRTLTNREACHTWYDGRR